MILTYTCFFSLGRAVRASCVCTGPLPSLSSLQHDRYTGLSASLESNGKLIEKMNIL